MRPDRTKSPTRFFWGVLWLVGCTQTAEKTAGNVALPSHSASAAPPLAELNDAGAALPALSVGVDDASAPTTEAGADAGDSPFAKYVRRETMIPAQERLSVFEYPGQWVCPRLPEKRPSDFTLILMTRGHDPGERTYYGVSEKIPCHMPWSAPWISVPKTGCKALSADKFDKVYDELRKLSPETIRTHELTGYVSPHRGGWEIHMRWGNKKERDVECSISDIGKREVDPSDRDRFDATKMLIVKAYE